MTSEDPSKRSLADDPHFLDSLSGLDHGFDENEPPRPARPDARPPIPRTAAIPAAVGPPTGTSVKPLFQPTPAIEGHRPRRLLELFPPPEDLETAASSAAPGASPRQPARRAPAVERRTSPAVRPPSPPPAGYETFYGLNERPFSLASDLRFLYHSTAHDRAAQAMLDAIRRRDGIVVLTGEMGTGKTMLCRAVMEQLDRRTLTSFVGDPFVTPQDLLKTVLVDFGVVSHADRSVGRLTEASLADLSAALRDFLYSLAPLQAFAVVIIDEAQSLSVDLLEQVRLLAETGGDEQLLQLLLVGQPSLAGTLAKPALRTLFQRVSARMVLGPLTDQETPVYVAHRLQVAGPAARIEFDAEATSHVHALSRGIPRVVNLLCDRALILGQQESASTIDARLVRRAAEDLDLAPPSSRRSLAIRKAAIVAGFVLLALVGAAAGAFVYRTEVTALIEQWRAPPVPPAAPRLDPPPTPPPSAPPDTAASPETEPKPVQ